MNTGRAVAARHPAGEQPSIEYGKKRSVIADTFAGRVHVEWAKGEGAALTPLGQLPFFIEYLKQGGLFDAWVAGCPLSLTSPNAPPKRDILGTVMVSVLAGHRRYAHITTRRCDPVTPPRLGMNKVVSADAVRRALSKIAAEAGRAWRQEQLDYCTRPLVREPWILDVDTTVKPLYGHQRCYGASGERMAPSSLQTNRRGCPMPQANDLSRCLTALDQDSTLIAVIEMSQSRRLVAGIVPGIERHPAKKLDPNEAALLRLRHRWRSEAARAGRKINRIAVAFEAGRDGVWLAPHGSSPWAEGSRLRARDVEAQVIHPTSIAVSREHRRAKTDRLDVALLKRSFLGWLRGDRDHCPMIAIPSLEEEDARRPGRARDALVGERRRIINRIKRTLAWLGIRGFKPNLRKAAARLETLRTPEGAPLPGNTLAELRRGMTRLPLLGEQIGEIESARLQRLQPPPRAGAHPMIRLLAPVRGVGIETADLLAQEAFARLLRDQRAVARFGGLTGAPDESGRRRREKGLARAGNARVRRGMIQLAWRFLMFQKDSALARWYRRRTADARGATRKTMIVALARKLLISLWRLATTGEIPEGVVLRPAA